MFNNFCGISNDYEIQSNTDPNDASNTPVDVDGDGIPDGLDEDRDGDGVNNGNDAFPDDPNEQSDLDGDGFGDNADTDRDGDGVDNTQDLFPNDPSESSDLDNDGIGDNSDDDIDGDGVVNLSDAYPRDPTRTTLPTVTITSPSTLTTVGATPVLVTGTAAVDIQSFTVNGIVVNVSNQAWSANVDLNEGHNTIVAKMIDLDGAISTASISLSLDMTPPYITVDSHEEGQTVCSNQIAVSGLINDIVRGTIEEGQAQVTVNGQSATISNRSYLVENIDLQPGLNALTINASDAVGNVAQITHTINYQVPTSANSFNVVSGQNQVSPIKQALAQPLVVRYQNSQGQGVANKTVVFRVAQGSGLISSQQDFSQQAQAITTDANGQAQVNYQLGARSGTGNHKVTATIVGEEQQLTFYATATSMSGNKLSVNSGNNQRAGIHQPLPAPFIVAVTDEGGNTVVNATVRFNVIAGGGLFQNGQSSLEVTTDSDGKASAHLTLGALQGLDVQKVKAVLMNGNEETPYTAGFTASGFIQGAPENTTISGLVFDNQDKPLTGTTVRIDGTTRQAIVDTTGTFKITQVPVGPVHLIVDGSTTSIDGEYPTLSYHIVTISGVDNPLYSPIYMVKLNTDSAVNAGAQDVVITLDEVPGFKLEVAEGSATFPDGSKQGQISATAVNASKLPMAPPNGIQPQFIVTIQPTGTKFDPPARLTVPNIEGHAAGAQVELFSYDHDLEEFVAIGLGTVSRDATIIESNPGVGVIKAGWHGGPAVPNPNGNTDNGDDNNTPDEDNQNDGDDENDQDEPNDEPDTCPTTNSGNPINMATGIKSQTETDYVGSGSYPISIARSYSSDMGFWEFGIGERIRSVNSSGFFENIADPTRLKITMDNFVKFIYEVKANGPTHTEFDHLLIAGGKKYWSNNDIFSAVYWSGGSGNTIDVTLQGDSPIDIHAHYAFARSSGEVRYYDDQGRPLARVKSNGDYWVYQWITIDSSHVNVTISNNSGESATYYQTLNNTWQVTQVVINGLVYQYDYLALSAEDISNLASEQETYGTYLGEPITKVTYPDGTTTTYHYENNRYRRHLTGMTDELGYRYATWQYDRQGRGILSEHALEAESISLRYHPDGSVTQTNELGKQSTFYFKTIKGGKYITDVEGHASLNCQAANKAYTYDDEGQKLSQTDWKGNTTTFEYNDRGLRTKIIKAQGTPQAQTTINQWHATKPLITQINEDGQITDMAYNADGRLTSTTKGNRTTQYGYDAKGNINHIDGPRTDVSDITTLTYDAKSNLTSITNPLGHQVELKQYNAYNLPQQIVNANGITTELAYNARGHLIKSTVKSRDGDATTHLTVDALGQIIQTQDPNGVIINYEYDEARRLSAISNPAGERIDYLRDPMGNITQQTIKNTSGQLEYQHTQLFDELGRLLESIDANAHSTQYQYDVNDNPTQTLDANQNATNQAYDPLDRLISSTDALSQVTNLDHDNNDNLNNVTDARGLVTTYSYNEHNEIISQNSPDTSITTYTYDSAGNIITKTDSKGDITTYQYDVMNRVVQISYSADAAATQIYSYDVQDLGNNPQTYSAGKGRLSLISQQNSSIQYRYNDRGDIIEQQNSIKNQSNAITHNKNTQYHYDLGSNISQISDANGLDIIQTRDTEGRVASISVKATVDNTNTTKSIVNSIQYQAFGQIKQLNWGNGLSLIRDYDKDGKLKSHTINDNVTPIQNLQYGYDNSFHLTQITDLINQNQSSNYDYDEVYQLIQHSQGYNSLSYSYDAVGNRTQSNKSHSVYQTNTADQYDYAADSNQLQSINNQNQSYDQNGHTISRDHSQLNNGEKSQVQFSYDHNQRLKEVSENNAVKASYRYNAKGQRILKHRTTGDYTLYNYNQIGQLITEQTYDQNDTKTQQKSYVWLNNQPVAMITSTNNPASINNTEITYIHTDHLNTPRLATNESKTEIWQWTNEEAFGNNKADTDPDNNGEHTNLNLRFPGQYYDQETGLHYNYFRDYDPSTGRYIESDNPLASLLIIS